MSIGERIFEALGSKLRRASILKRNKPFCFYSPIPRQAADIALVGGFKIILDFLPSSPV